MSSNCELTRGQTEFSCKGRIGGRIIRGDDPQSLFRACGLWSNVRARLGSGVSYVAIKELYIGLLTARGAPYVFWPTVWLRASMGNCRLPHLQWRPFNTSTGDCTTDARRGTAKKKNVSPQGVAGNAPHCIHWHCIYVMMAFFEIHLQV